jgi:hypothetical protein
MNLVFQGTVDTSGGTRIDCAYDNMMISTMVFNNQTGNYTLTVKRLEIEAGSLQTLLYKFELANGDSVRDMTQYKMSKGDYINLESTQANTTYYISAEVE